MGSRYFSGIFIMGGVLIMPGTTAFTVTPSFPPSRARVFVRPRTPAFAAASRSDLARVLFPIAKYETPRFASLVANATRITARVATSTFMVRMSHCCAMASAFSYEAVASGIRANLRHSRTEETGERSICPQFSVAYSCARYGAYSEVAAGETIPLLPSGPGRKEARAPRRAHRRRWQPSSPVADRVRSFQLCVSVSGTRNWAAVNAAHTITTMVNQSTRFICFYRCLASV